MNLPRIVLAAVVLLAAAARADVAPDWHAGFGAPPAGLGLDGDPRALLAHGGSLYCGGSFTQAGDASAWYAARLDETLGQYAWTSLGPLDNRVNALAAWGDSVLAGGRFTDAAGTAVNRVAVWDGAAWHPVGDPGAWAWGHVNALAEVDGVPWAAGTGFVVRWNGTAWTAMTGAGFTGDVFALAALDGGIAAGGAFASIVGTSGDPVAAANVARWNGEAWEPLGGGLDDTCYALASWNGALVAGGVFTAPAPLAARWNGSGWSALGAGLSGTFVTALAPWGARLIVGGDLSGAGAVPVSDVALFDGAAWSDMTGGVLGMVRAVAPFGGAAAVGGGFTLVRGGTLASSHIGLWVDPSVDVATPPPPPVLRASPNPFNPRTVLRCDLPHPATADLAAFDLAGRRVRTLLHGSLDAGPHDVAWDGRDDAGRALPAGVYVLRLRTDGSSASRRVSLVR